MYSNSHPLYFIQVSKQQNPPQPFFLASLFADSAHLAAAQRLDI